MDSLGHIYYGVVSATHRLDYKYLLRKSGNIYKQISMDLNIPDDIDFYQFLHDHGYELYVVETEDEIPKSIVQ